MTLSLLLGWAFSAIFEIPRIHLYPLEVLTLLGTGLEQKRELLDGELYLVAKMCEREIPPSTPIVFYAARASSDRRTLPLSDDFLRVLDRQKLSYFLYPRPVYWELDSLRNPIQYVLIYHAHESIPGFTHRADFKEDIYLLKRE